MRRAAVGLRRGCGLLLVLGAFCVSWAGSGLDPVISDLNSRIEQDELLVSFRLDHALSEDTLERLHSGDALQFQHRVELIRRKNYWVTPSRTLGRTVVESQVEYDSLTRQYRLYRRTENETRGAVTPYVDTEVRRSTKSLSEAVDWLVAMQDVPLAWSPDPALENRLKVRVESLFGRRMILYMVPSRRSISAELRLEF